MCKHVLIVDDNPLMKPLMETAATDNAALDVTIVAGGLEAIDLLSDSKHEIDAVLIDLAMYPMNGITLSENLRSMERVAPVHAQPLKLAFFTAQEIDEVILRAADDVEAQIFTKPCDPLQLLSDIEDWLDK